jgi:hypothetical protein
MTRVGLEPTTVRLKIAGIKSPPLSQASIFPQLESAFRQMLSFHPDELD